MRAARSAKGRHKYINHGEARRAKTWNQIKPLLEEGLDRNEIASRFRISPSTIWNYINGPYKS